jgi:hypothetical protein
MIEEILELRSEGSISMGLEDFLMGLASERETAVYLLRQRGSADAP